MLFRNAEVIEIMRKVDTLVVDKTGTLTEGKPKLMSVLPASGFEEQALLRLAATLERGSEHPLAAAIVKGSEERGVRLGDASGFQSITGKGVRGSVDGRTVALGNRALMVELRIELGDLTGKATLLDFPRHRRGAAPSQEQALSCLAKESLDNKRPPGQTAFRTSDQPTADTKGRLP